jgi:hypothetical protein
VVHPSEDDDALDEESQYDSQKKRPMNSPPVAMTNGRRS